MQKRFSVLLIATMLVVVTAALAWPMLALASGERYLGAFVVPECLGGEMVVTFTNDPPSVHGGTTGEVRGSSTLQVQEIESEPYKVSEIIIPESWVGVLVRIYAVPGPSGVTSVSSGEFTHGCVTPTPEPTETATPEVTDEPTPTEEPTPVPLPENKNCPAVPVPWAPGHKVYGRMVDQITFEGWDTQVHFLNYVASNGTLSLPFWMADGIWELFVIAHSDPEPVVGVSQPQLWVDKGNRSTSGASTEGVCSFFERSQPEVSETPTHEPPMRTETPVPCEPGGCPHGEARVELPEQGILVAYTRSNSIGGTVVAPAGSRVWTDLGYYDSSPDHPLIYAFWGAHHQDRVA